VENVPRADWQGCSVGPSIPKPDSTKRLSTIYKIRSSQEILHGRYEHDKPALSATVDL
jgi:hypothetical protein